MARRYVRDNRGRFASTGATARGGRLKTAAGNKRQGQTMKASGAASSGTMRGKLKRDPGAAGKMGGGKSSTTKVNATKRKQRISDDKISRVIGRVNNVTRSAESKTGVKRMNSTEVGVRAKNFLARKAGGVGMINQMSQPDSFRSVRSAMAKPPRYSTQKPNRNKPRVYDQLGQSKARAAAALAARTPSQLIAATKSARQPKPKPASSRLLGRRELITSSSVSAPNVVRVARRVGTIKPPKQQAKASGNVARSRKQAASVQRHRRNAILSRTRPIIGKNPRIQGYDTGMSQLSLVGKAKALKGYRRTSR